MAVVTGTRAGVAGEPPRIAPTWALWTVTAAVLALMVLGSLADYAISETLLNESSTLGRLGAAAGWFPSLIALSCAGTLLVLAAKDTQISPTFRRIQRAGGGTLIVGSLAGYAAAPSYWNEGETSTPADFFSWGAVGVVLTCASVGFSWWIGRDAPARQLRMVAVFFLLVVTLQSAIIFVVKLLWLRPRMRLIVQDIGVEFEPWWIIGYPDAQRFLDAGIPKDDFKSFPSAHTGNAAVSVTLAGLATLRERVVRAIPWFFALGLLWTSAVAGSRIIVGAHFLTDTTVGFLVTFVCTVSLYWLLFGSRAFGGQEVTYNTRIKK